MNITTQLWMNEWRNKTKLKCKKLLTVTGVSTRCTLDSSINISLALLHKFSTCSSVRNSPLRKQLKYLHEIICQSLSWKHACTGRFGSLHTSAQGISAFAFDNTWKGRNRFTRKSIGTQRWIYRKLHCQSNQFWMTRLTGKLFLRNCIISLYRGWMLQSLI